MSVVTKQTLIPFRAPAKLARFPRARPLVGRDGDVARVIGLVDRGERLITVLGPPGIGKTSLATCVAERLSARLGAWFCDLSNQRNEAELCAQLTSLLGNPSGDVGELLASLGPALVVLDNFEQLSSASPLLLAWCHAAPEAVFIVTSRERLAVDRECVVELEPLGAAESMQLFQLRAEDAGASPSHDAQAIAEIVRRLDGIPLAIELAAARTRLMSAAELAKRLLPGGDVLTLGKRSPQRHKTLADAIEWSWQLLSQEEQRALACCSVFAGSFRIEIAERVLGAVLSSDVTNALAALREKSLIHMASDDRLGLYLSIRDFAAQKLDPELRALVRVEHARVFGELAMQFTRSRLLLNRMADAFPHGGLLEDADNLVTALEGSANPTLRAELASALTFLGAMPADACERALRAIENLPPPLEAIVHLALQHALIVRGRFDEGLAEAQQVIEHLDVPAEMRAAALVRVGIQQRANGDALGALESHERASALIGKQPSSLRGINVACTGRLMCDLRRIDAARTLNDEAAAVCEQAGEHWLAALGPANLAQLEQELGDFERAEARLERAMARFHYAREPVYEGFYAAVCGGLYLEWGKHELARHWYRIGEGTFDALSAAFSQVVLRGGWAALEALAGDASAALHQLELARRSLVRSPGGLARIVMEAHNATVEVALELAGAEKLETHRARWHELSSGESADATIAVNNLDTRFALRILGRALGASKRVLRVKRGGLWFSLSGGRVDLSRRAALRRLVDALSHAHGAQPGAALGVDALFAHGWPGQRIQTESAATRVRVAIATLRKLGLRDVLLTRDDGYLFDPDSVVDIER